MAVFLIEYDLRKQRDYEKLYAELNRLKAVRILESLWSISLAKPPNTCSSLRDHFSKFIDADDRLLVSQIVDWAGRHILDKPHTNF